MEIKAYLVLRSDLDLQIEIYNSFFDLIFAGLVTTGARATMASARRCVVIIGLVVAGSGRIGVLRPRVVTLS